MWLWPCFLRANVSTCLNNTWEVVVHTTGAAIFGNCDPISQNGPLQVAGCNAGAAVHELAAENASTSCVLCRRRDREPARFRVSP